MLASSLFALVLSAGALAVPVNKRDVVTVTEIDYYDSAGTLLHQEFKVGEPETKQEPLPQPAAPAPEPAAPAPQAAAPAPQPAAAPPTNNNINSGSSTDANADALHVGWVEPSDPKFAAIAAYHHNVHRANHSVDPVTYDNELANYAQLWASSCQGEEDVHGCPGCGMNVGFSSEDPMYNPSKAISGGWYNSEVMAYPAYGQPNLPVDSDNLNKWGHYAQVVWPDTKKIGCGIAKCPGGAINFGCVYQPAGNIIGSFDKVKQPTGQPIVFPNGQTHF